MSAHLTARLTLGKVPASDRPLRVSVNVPAPTVPVPSTRWQISAIGGQWGAFQLWAGPVYWLRLFDTFAEAIQFVQKVMAKAAITK